MTANSSFPVRSRAALVPALVAIVALTFAAAPPRAGAVDTLASDSFQREVVGGWGALDTGGTWLITNGNEATASVTGGVGRMLHSATGPFLSELKARVPEFAAADVDIRADFRAQAAADAAGGVDQFMLYSRYDGPPDFQFYIRLVVEFSVGQTVPIMRIDRQSTVYEGGIAVGSADGPNDPTVWWTLRLQTVGNQIRAKAWPTSQPEPEAWDIDIVDTGVVDPNQFGLGTYASDVEPPVTFEVDNVVVTAPAPPPPPPPASPFTDIAGSPFKGEIEWLYSAGITNGCNPTLFCPLSSVTREQMASFLARALALPSSGTDFFTDDEASPHEADINRIAAAGITIGCGGGVFCPADLVTREQMASFLARALALGAPSADYFTDDEQSPHENDINRLAEAGITNGCGGGRYCPAPGVTREQMAAFLYRALAP